MSGNIEAAWFVNGLGQELNLSTMLDESQFKQGLNGRFMGPVEHVIDQTPGNPGGFYRGTKRGLAALTLPLLLTGDNPDELRRKELRMSRFLSTSHGPGELHVRTTWGQHRVIPALYESGLDDDPATDGNETDWLVSVVFRALSSYWYDPTPVTTIYRKGEKRSSFFPGPPWILGQSSVFARWNERNEGDAKSWPVITVTGPGTALEVRNERTGQAIAMGFTIPPGVTLVADSRNKTFSYGSNPNIWAYMSKTDFFPLLPGDNSLRVQLIDIDESTRVKVEHYTQYEGV